MQITIRSTRIIKEGTQKKSGQPFKWCSVIADDGSEKGTEYTTFDAKVLNLGRGSIIDIGDPQIKEGKLSFAKVVEVVQEIAAHHENGGGKPSGVYKRDIESIREEYDLKRELQAIDRISIEQQSAYNRVMEILPHYEAIKLPAEQGKKLKDLIDKALAWGADRFGQKAPAPKPAPKGKDVVTGKGEKVDPNAPFPHIGALLNWCKEKGITREKFMEILNVKETQLQSVNIEDAYQIIQDYLKEQPADEPPPEE